MAMTQSSQAVDTDGQAFSLDRGVSKIWIRNRGSNPLLVNVPEIHGDSSSFEVIEVGEVANFESIKAPQIKNYFAKGSGGSASFDQGVAAR